MKIFYIHGFRSSPESKTKSDLEKFIGHPVIGLTYDHERPFSSIVDLSTQILRESDGDGEVYVIGSSLGGFYASQVSYILRAPTYILYNPAVNPAETLKSFDVPESTLYEYRKFGSLPFNNEKVSRVVIACSDDDLIDANTTKDYYKNNEFILSTGGHRMTDDNAKLIAEKIKFLHNQLEGVR